MGSDPVAQPITPDMKVAELLEAHPDLEAVLIAQAPAFSRLKNPILRRTVARVATLRQAAAVGEMEVRTLVATLRRAAGQPIDEASLESAGDGTADAFASTRPDWVEAGRLRGVVDADALLASGRVPLPEVADHARDLGPGDLLRVDAAFRPVPLVDALGKQGFRSWVRQAGPDRFEAYFGRRS